MKTMVPLRRRLGGQSTMEYLIVAAALSLALFAAPSTLETVLAAFSKAYENFTYALSQLV